jgi:type IV secretory pathway component VirB8
MGQHTWFVRYKKILLLEREIYEILEHQKIDEHTEKYLVDVADDLNATNNTEYHDLFRTSKRTPDGMYIEDEIISSEKECLEWINNPENKVSFANTIFDTPEQIEENKKYALEKLKEFWQKYPDGAIYFA